MAKQSAMLTVSSLEIVICDWTQKRVERTPIETVTRWSSDSFRRRPVFHSASSMKLYTLCLKKRPTFGLLYNFDTREQICDIFGRNATDKVGNHKTL